MSYNLRYINLHCLSTSSCTKLNNMDRACVVYDYDEKKVIHELTQGLQMTQQLRVSLHSPQARDFMIGKILSSYENALFALRSGHSVGQPPSLPESSSISFGSPGSEEFEFQQPFSGSKKRKGPVTMEDEVRICSDSIGLDGNNGDGYNWRKYGQKHIQGAKFPRSYYRCSYRKVEKCFATKQVQRTDEDPTVFDIAYKGKHTCHQSASPSPPQPPPSPEKHETTPTHHHQQLSLPSPREMLSNLKANLSVNTSDLNGGSDTNPSPLSLSSTSFGLMEDHHQLHLPNYYDDELLQVFSPTFISLGTSESIFFPECESLQSLDFMADPADVDLDFEFKNPLF